MTWHHYRAAVRSFKSPSPARRSDLDESPETAWRPARPVSGVAVLGLLGVLGLLAGCSSPAERAPRRPEGVPECSVETRLDGGGEHVYRLSLEAEHYARVKVEQRGIDVLLELSSPDGRLLTTVDSPNGTEGPETVSLVSGDGGLYTLAVRSLDTDAEPGQYEIRLVDRRPATAEDRRRVEAEHAFAKAERLLGEGDREALSRAVRSYAEAARTWRRLGDEPHLAQAVYRRGLAHARGGDWEAAGEDYRAALELFTRLGDVRQQAVLENRIGWIARRTGDPRSAAGHFRRAGFLFRALGHEIGVGAALANAGTAFVDLGELQNALAAYREARTIFRDLGETRREADARVNLGVLMLQLDRLDLARQDFAAALGIYRELEDSRRVAVALKWLADVAYQDGRLDEALELIEESLEIRRRAEIPRDQAIAANTLGNIRRERGEPAAALAAYHEALELLRSEGPSREAATTLLDLARLHAEEGRAETALAHYAEALERFEATSSPRGEAASRMGLARTLRDLGRLDPARVHIAAAVDLVDALRAEPASFALRRSYRDFRQGYYELQVDLLARLAELESSPQRAAEAFVAAEEGRARALLESLARGRMAAASTLSPARSRRRATLEGRLEELLRPSSSPRSREARETDRRAEIARLLVQLEELAAPEPAVNDPLSTEVPPFELEVFQRRFLDDETLVLAFALGEKRGHLWTLDRERLTHHVLPPLAELELLARHAHAALQRAGSEGRESTRRTTARLSESLLGPVADRLGAKRLVIVADGPLHLLPFAALPDPRSLGAAEDEAPFLLETHEIVTLPSLSVLSALRREPARPTRPTRSSGLLAVVADPVFAASDPRLAAPSPVVTASLPSSELMRSVRDVGLDGLERLPRSGEEARAILELVEAAPTRRAIGLAARRDTVLGGDLAGYRILHFATHGLLHPTHPELSGLVLSLVDAEGRPRNGFLRAYEVAALDLPAELVVLSACRTGLGREVRGEGLVGLSHSFMSAGASRVVVSLWNVGDESTAVLMERFYRHLLEDGAPPSAALRAAQLSMLRDDEWTLPRSWAAFVFQGDWRGFPATTNQGGF